MAASWSSMSCSGSSPLRAAGRRGRRGPPCLNRRRPARTSGSAGPAAVCQQSPLGFGLAAGPAGVSGPGSRQTGPRSPNGSTTRGEDRPAERRHVGRASFHGRRRGHCAPRWSPTRSRPGGPDPAVVPADPHHQEHEQPGPGNGQAARRGGQSDGSAGVSPQIIGSDCGGQRPGPGFRSGSSSSVAVRGALCR